MLVVDESRLLLDPFVPAVGARLLQDDGSPLARRRCQASGDPSSWRRRAPTAGTNGSRSKRDSSTTSIFCRQSLSTARSCTRRWRHFFAWKPRHQVFAALTRGFALVLLASACQTPAPRSEPTRPAAAATHTPTAPTAHSPPIPPTTPPPTP